ncbi:MAG: hypothetical protein CL793_06600 [Chloroflexi bacterium]|nr:hypothetical protein [Chloroflexota bacterium]|tara:strand:- start:2620 stop:2910 length:291 start_codon:yes stop_codon:yes gene_type:complete
MPENQGMIMGMWKDLHAILQRMTDESGYGLEGEMPITTEEDILAGMGQAGPPMPMGMGGGGMAPAGPPVGDEGMAGRLGPEEEAILAAMQGQGRMV